MKRLALLLLITGCGETIDPPPSASWRIETRTTIEDGAYLSPDDPQKPGEAAPSAMVRRGDELWIAYAHLRAYRPAGPGWLARHDATTLERTALLPLVSDDVECRNPVALNLSGDTLHVACAGAISFGEPSDDGVVMNVAIEDTTITTAGRIGHSPGSITRAGDELWLGDGEQGGLWRVDARTLTGAEHVSPCLVDETHQGYVADVFADGDRVFAACFNDDTVVELNASGAVRGTPLPVGDAPIKLARLGDLLYVLDNLGGTLSIIDPRDPPVSRAAALNLGRDGTQGGNDPQGLAGDATLAGITNSAWGTFVVLDLQASPPTLSAAVDLKPSAGAPSNFPTAVTYADGVFHVLVPGLEHAANEVPGEIVRITRATP